MTGVQTCALPIYSRPGGPSRDRARRRDASPPVPGTPVLSWIGRVAVAKIPPGLFDQRPSTPPLCVWPSAGPAGPNPPRLGMTGWPHPRSCLTPRRGPQATDPHNDGASRAGARARARVGMLVSDADVSRGMLRCWFTREITVAGSSHGPATTCPQTGHSTSGSRCEPDRSNGGPKGPRYLLEAGVSRAYPSRVASTRAVWPRTM